MYDDKKISFNSIVYVYLLVKFLFCLFSVFVFYQLPFMVNKDVYKTEILLCAYWTEKPRLLRLHIVRVWNIIALGW